MADAIRATYADIKTVRTRKVYQIVFEGPIEEMGEAMKLFGPPMPDAEVWAGIARLRRPAQQSPQIEHANDEAPPRSLSQIAAMLCNKVPFRRFLTETKAAGGGLTADDAAEWVRRYCKVASRRELDTDPNAAALFRDLRSSFDAWMMVPA